MGSPVRIEAARLAAPTEQVIRAWIAGQEQPE